MYVSIVANYKVLVCTVWSIYAIFPSPNPSVTANAPRDEQHILAMVEVSKALRSTHTLSLKEPSPDFASEVIYTKTSGIALLLIHLKQIYITSKTNTMTNKPFKTS
jgi:hypothetical protein